jgi:DNA-binding transcriptional regulator YdaS (Cro superfamily)
MDYSATFEEVVSKFGGLTKFAEALGESVQTASNWRHRQIPAARAKAVESLTGISVRRIRPDDWQLYWPELKRGRAS